MNNDRAAPVAWHVAMEAKDALDPPVRVTLLGGSQVDQTFEARCVADLRVRVELMSGIAWLELMPHYQRLIEQGLDELQVSDRVCHSYEKWGDWQQETLAVDVCLQRMGAGAGQYFEKEIRQDAEENVQWDSEEKRDEVREDLRAEWYREFAPFAASKPCIPRIYWLGLAASAVWLVVYLLLYFSLPSPGG